MFLFNHFCVKSSCVLCENRNVFVRFVDGGVAVLCVVSRFDFGYHGGVIADVIVWPLICDDKGFGMFVDLAQVLEIVFENVDV